MMSTEKCRALLGSVDVTDREVGELREQLYSLARLFIESWVERDEASEKGNVPVPERAVIWARQKPEE